MATGNIIVKDLSLIGRDMTKCMIVDNVSDNFIMQPDNGIFIKTWYDDMSDTQLYDLIPLLRGKLRVIIYRFGRKTSR